MISHVKVLLVAMFRQIAGQREILEEVGPNATLRSVLTTLAKRYGKDFNDIIDAKTGQISVETWVMVNGRSVRRTDIELKDNDVIMIGVPIGGG